MIRSAAARETLQPFPNLGKTGFWGSLRFQARLFFDFQVATVYRDLRAFFGPARAGRILEVGGGANPYRHLFRGCKVWTLEIDASETAFGYASDSIRYDGARFPFKTGSLDCVFHTEVLEHVYDTGGFLSECARILKTGGSMFFTVPFSARYHYKPYDYWRFTPSALDGLCRTHGFSVSSISARGDALTVILNKAMVFAVGAAWTGWSGNPLRLLVKLAWMPVAAVLVPALAVFGQILLRTRWIGNTDDCLGFTVVCVKEG
jgi:SAM-dependent methyltransferase